MQTFLSHSPTRNEFAGSLNALHHLSVRHAAVLPNDCRGCGRGHAIVANADDHDLVNIESPFTSMNGTETY